MFNNKESFYRNALEKYAGNHLLNLIEKNKDDQLKLSGEIKEITVSFYNIIGYPMPVDNSKSQLFMDFLYAYYEAVFYGIEKNNGVVINLYGNEIISFFGYESKDHEIEAIKSYFDSVNKFKEFLQSKNMGHMNIIGNGINTGKVALGNFGSKNRLFYTILGDHVDFTDRLLHSNKLYKTNLITSDFTYQKVKNDVIARELEKIYVVGFKEPQHIYEIVSLK